MDTKTNNDSADITAILNSVKREVKDELITLLGTQSRAAKDCSVTQQTLSDNVNVAKADSQLSLRTLAELLYAAQKLHGGRLPSPVPGLSAFCRGFGLDLMHTAEATDPRSWLESIGDLSKEASDVLKAITLALEGDNEVDAADVIDLNMIREVHELQAVLATLLARLMKVVAPREEAIAGPK